MSKKKSEKKWKTKILWAKITSFLAPCPSALGQLDRSSSENTGKMSLILVSTKIQHGLIQSQNWTCLVFTESLWNMQFTRPKEKIEKKLFFFAQAAQTAINQFLVSRNFRG
jgi:hypothetical protein